MHRSEIMSIVDSSFVQLLCLTLPPLQVWRHLVLEAKMRANAAAQAAAAEAARSHAPSPKPAPDRRGPVKAATGGEAQQQQPPAWHALQPGLAALTALEDPDEVVLGNIHVDGAPLVGRAKLHLQYLWRDIAGRCCTLQVDYMPCAPPPPRSPAADMNLVDPPSQCPQGLLTSCPLRG